MVFLGLNARDPYGSSKYLVNLISSYLQSSNIKSFVCDPGTLASNITLSLVPWFFEYPIKIFYRLLQPFTPKLTGNTDLATASLIHVFEKYSSLAVDNVKVDKEIEILKFLSKIWNLNEFSQFTEESYKKVFSMNLALVSLVILIHLLVRWMFRRISLKMFGPSWTKFISIKNCVFKDENLR